MNITRYTANEIINGAVRDVYTTVYVRVEKVMPDKTKKERKAATERIVRKALTDIIGDRALLNRVFDVV